MSGSQKKRLKATKVEYFEVEYSDFQDLVEEVYKQNYSFPADVECGNDSQHSFSVTKNIDEYDWNKLERFREKGKYLYLASTLLNDLARKGIIEEGNYIINVCW